MSTSGTTSLDPEAVYEQHFPLLVERAVTEFHMDGEAAATLAHEILLASLRQSTINVAWLDGALTLAMRAR